MGSSLPEMKCGLCGKRLDPHSPFFRAGGAFLPSKDPLTRFANAPMHWQCYAGWLERPRFARHFVDEWVRANRKNPFWWSAYRDERVYVSVNPQPPVEAASIRLYAVGSDIRVPLSRWAEWLTQPQKVTPDLQPLELETLAEALPMLKTRLPDDHAVVDAIDVAEKKSR